MTTSTFSAEVASFADLQADFVRLVAAIVWCTVATVDHRDRPRTRIFHPYWEIDGDRPIGWVSTFRSPAKTAHLARNPYVSCSYWTPAHDAVFVDCRAGWVDDSEQKHHAWDMATCEGARSGWDPHTTWKGGPTDPLFAVLRLDPWRVQITLQDLANGRIIGSSRVWHSPG